MDGVVNLNRVDGVVLEKVVARRSRELFRSPLPCVAVAFLPHGGLLGEVRVAPGLLGIKDGLHVWDSGAGESCEGFATLVCVASLLSLGQALSLSGGDMVRSKELASIFLKDNTFLLSEGKEFLPSVGLVVDDCSAAGSSEESGCEEFVHNYYKAFKPKA